MKILITDDVHPFLLTEFEKRNYDFDYLPKISLEVCKEICPKYDGLIINSKIKVDKDFLSRAINLRWIARLGSGMEIIDIPEAYARNIYLISTPEANCNAVAEHVLGLLLSLFRHIPRANSEVKLNDWRREQNRGTEIRSKNIGIIGFGHTGSSFARLLAGFGANIIIFDKYKQLNENTDRYRVVKSLSQLQEEAEVISLHLPLTDETRYLVNELFIAENKNPFYLLNSSRGQIVDTVALISGLRSGKVLGAGLDVFENEKPSSYTPTESELYDKLFKMDNVICTPHIAGWTHESKLLIAQTVLKKLENMLNLNI